MYRVFQEQLELYYCMFEIEANNNKQQQSIQAPRIMIEQQFVSLVEQAANSNSPVRIRMSRKVPIYDDMTGESTEQEIDVVFTNIAWNNK